MKKNEKNVAGGKAKASKSKVVGGAPMLKSSFSRKIGSIATNYELYLMLIPVILFYAIFLYWPMYGVVMAFQNYKPFLGINGSEWIGLENFMSFITSHNFDRTMTNTLTISIATLIFSFPTPIILALLINEVRNKTFARSVQTITYMPHFISLVIACSIVREFTADSGIINQFAQLFGYNGQTMLQNPKLFVPIYVVSGIWQEIGWNSIIYLAALSSIDAQLYEAAEIDGAGKFAQLIHVTLPGILPTIVILFIMKMGSLLSVGYEKVLLLYNPGIYETSDIVSTYTYRLGIENAQYGLSTAVGLFNSIINIILLVATNKICDKLNGTSLF